MNPEPGTLNPEPGAGNPEPGGGAERDTPMPATYIGVLVFEALIITALFWLGRLFS